MEFNLGSIKPHIRYVNNYKPPSPYIEPERVLFDYEFLYVMDGEAKMHYDGRTYNIKKSDLFYIRPGVKNQLEVDDDSQLRLHCIHFDWTVPCAEDDFDAPELYLGTDTPELIKRKCALAKRSVPEPVDGQLPPYMPAISYEKFAALFSRCFHAYICKTPVSQLKLKAVFYEIVASLVQQFCTDDGGQMVHPKIIYAIEYIKENYTTHLTAPELAAEFGLSPKYFGTLFKAATGVSVSEFILGLRLYAAKEMLIGTSLGIEEIAARTGFANVYYFSKCFKDKEHVSPSAYRGIMTKAYDSHR